MSQHVRALLDTFVVTDHRRCRGRVRHGLQLMTRHPADFTSLDALVTVVAT